MEYYSAIKKNETLPFATTWIDLKGIMLSKIISQAERQILYYFTYNLKKMNKPKKKKQTHKYKKTNWWLPEGRWVG